MTRGGFVLRFAKAFETRALSIGLVAAIYAFLALVAAGCDPCASCTTMTTPVPGAAHFVFTGPMTDSRIFHTANLLSSGQVLVAGGSQIPGTLDSAEIYDPTSGTFTATSGSMTQARHHHTATLLNDGTVLVAGGDNGGGLLLATAFLSAELYDPATDKFTATGAMFSPRTWQTATLLADGKVLMAGGSPAVDSTINPETGNGSGLPVGALPNAELYSPASKQFFGNPGAMNDARTEHAAALIKGCACATDNQVLLTGGVDASGATLSSAELFNESANSFTFTGRMNVARHNHTATTLQDGRVLITGGVNNSFLLLDSAEIYDPTSGTFSPTATRMTEARAFHSAQILSDGRVLIAGGSGDNSAEIFDPSTNAFTATAGPMADVSFEQAAAQLPDGNVLIMGGALLLNAVGELIPNSSLDKAEVFSLTSDKFSATPNNMVHSRVGHTATMLKSGKVLITGGADLTVQIFATSELYDPVKGAFGCIGGTTGRDCTASLHQERFSQTAIALNGSSEVLIAGGSDGSTVGTPPNANTVHLSKRMALLISNGGG
ncbi:MAG: kelch repeat-containing protein, partial [Candidatus Binataceae bacterium]